MSRLGGDPNNTRYLKEARTSVCKLLKTGRTSTYAQQLDHALLASMRAAMIHSEDLRAVTFDRVKDTTKKDPELLKLMEALLTTHNRDNLPGTGMGGNRYV